MDVIKEKTLEYWNKLKNTKAFDFVINHKKPFIVSLVLVLILIISLLVYENEVLVSETGIKYEKQDYLRFGIQEIDTLNPIKTRSSDVLEISDLLYSSLFDFDQNLGIVNDIAKSYQVDTENAQIEIELRKDAKFTNGKAINANDVISTINAIKNTPNSYFYESASKIAACSATKDKKVKIYFANNYDCSLDDLTFPILPSDMADKSGNNFKPIGSGQYKYDGYTSSTTIGLSPNEKYYGEKASNKLVFTIFPEKKMIKDMLKIDAIVAYLDSSTQRHSYAEDNKLLCLDIPSNNVDFIVFNTSSNLLKLKQARQAICYAINMDDISENAYMGDIIKTDTVYYPNFLGVKDAGENYSLDIAKAIELLDRIGYTDKNKNGIIERLGVEGITLKVLYNNDNANRLAAAKIIKKDIENLGFTVELVGCDKKTYKNKISSKDFDILLTGYEINKEFDLRFLFNGRNPWGYSNGKLYEKSRLLDRLYSAEKYAEFYGKFKELLMDEIPYYPIGYKKMSMIGAEKLDAKVAPVFYSLYKNCGNWTWEKAILDEKQEAE